MINRHALPILRERLSEALAVALIGPRQVGKTTLARMIADERGEDAVYLDLEQPQDRARLADPAGYLARLDDKLVVLDEIHRAPELFTVLRGEIDARRRRGRPVGHFLVLGSAALPLLKQSSESLAGRISYVELTPFLPQELPEEVSPRAGLSESVTRLWTRGGFPSSFLAASDAASFRWRLNFIRSYLEREIPQFGIRTPSTTLERFWTMLAHVHGGLLNAQQLAGSLGVAWHSANHYLALMEDLLLVRRLQPWATNTKKRLVKSPKVYLRDSGILHALLGLRSFDDVLAHPIAGASFEGLAIEALIAAAPDGARAYFYRTQVGAEIDLVIELSAQHRLAIEIKSSSAPKATRGFHSACEDISPVRKILVYPGPTAYPGADGGEVLPLTEAIKTVARMGT